MVIQINCDKTKSLYLDERQNRNPKKFPKKLGENYFFIGGIEVLDSEKSFIAKFVREFKKELCPKKKSSSWELKGYIKKDDLIDAQNKWIKWASKLTDSKNLNYKLHGSFIELSKYSKHHPDANESDVIKKAYKDALKIFIEYRCAECHENIFEAFPSEVIFDNIEGGQKKHLTKLMKN